MNYKKRYQLLLGGAILFLVVAYWLAFSKTWRLRQEVVQLEQQRSNAGQLLQDIQHYEHQLTQLEAQQGNGAFTQNQLFQSVTTFCQEHQLAIQALPESRIYQEQDLHILHNEIQVQGAFIPMVQLIYALEQEQHLGRVVSVDFGSKRNPRSRQEELSASIYLQNIQNLPSSTVH